MNPQLKKGVVELCVLHILIQEDSYGYLIIEKLADEIELSEGTVYPMLRRFQKEKWVRTYLRESTTGPPRKYYSITEEGIKYYVETMKEWLALVDSVKKITGV